MFWGAPLSHCAGEGYLCWEGGLSESAFSPVHARPDCSCLPTCAAKPSSWWGEHSSPRSAQEFDSSPWTGGDSEMDRAQMTCPARPGRGRDESPYAPFRGRSILPHLLEPRLRGSRLLKDQGTALGVHPLNARAPGVTPSPSFCTWGNGLAGGTWLSHMALPFQRKQRPAAQARAQAASPALGTAPVRATATVTVGPSATQASGHG